MPTKTKEKSTSKNLLIFLGFLLSLGLVFYLYDFFNPEYTTCLTETYCVSSRGDAILWAGVRTLFILVLILTGKITIIICVGLIHRGLFKIFAGLMLTALGSSGIYVLVATTPSAELVDFIHIFIIGGLCATGGLWMFITGIIGKTRK